MKVKMCTLMTLYENEDIGEKIGFVKAMTELATGNDEKKDDLSA